jgi:glycosyltransferase involved in cell wall biosynthesis
MKILQWHGYLLRGTGSNVYNAQLSRAFASSGHAVTVFAQDRRPPDLGPGVVVHRPEIGDLLPVYVHDAYEGFRVKTFLDCSDDELERYVELNVAAVREAAERERFDLALANHLVMGPVILARALGPLGIPYAVKIHGSALEYVVKRDPGRFMPYAREGLAGAQGVLVGSRHTAESLWEAMGDPDLPARTKLGPPGVDVHAFTPSEDPAAGVRRLTARLHAAEAEEQLGSAFDRDVHAAAAALDRLEPERDRLVVYVGKLIVSKGVDLVAAAWPLVLRRVPDARLVVVGFGAYREGFERLLAALATGDLDAAEALAEEGRAAEGGPREPLKHLRAFLDGLRAEGDAPGSPHDREAYLAAAARLPDRVVVVGRLEHGELVDLLPACEAQLVTSTFPEAFGMVAAEAAAAGVLPVSAAHSGLAEVTALLADELPEEARPWLSFPVGPDSVPALADRIVSWLEADPALRERTRAALVRVARARFSWEGVANGVVAAAQGRLGELADPPVPRSR